MVEGDRIVHLVRFWLLLCVGPLMADIMWTDVNAQQESYINQHTQFYLNTARCYSCMSKFYEAVWPALSHVYKRPMNFTDSCNDEKIDKTKVPYTPCPTICVAMSEEATVAGMKIRGNIRGCLDDLLHNGFNQTIVSWYRWMHRDSCRIYRKRELFKLPPEQSDESSIQVCTCYADYCNSATVSPWPLPMIVMLGVLFTFVYN
ncbi:unnamed protein product [Bursaphelenchus xylophilus]|uniref:(pine wood nematode) hypothetical protein n=1 Tax=Bursaphelenchus xylophilus TaxID=6326 RepID=A0A811LUC2_BURXY|nr:unnamed protein product [Bursaphelenchus xylophilus]CAG9123609.1 unnamed protein product [Bursaphelenchus xylophilus]